MNKKGFSFIGILIALILLFFILQVFLTHYTKKAAKAPAKALVSAKKVAQEAKLNQEGMVKKMLSNREIPTNMQVMRVLTILSRAQQRHFAENHRYATKIQELKVPAERLDAPGYELGLRDDTNGWVVWAKKISMDKGGKFYLVKNAKNNQYCCEDIEEGSCEVNRMSHFSCSDKGVDLSFKK